MNKQKIIEEFHQKFCDFDSGSGRWWLKRDTRTLDIEQFIIEEFAQDRKALCEKIENMQIIIGSKQDVGEIANGVKKQILNIINK